MDPWPSVCPYPFQPKDVFRDFRARRAGIVRALTTDVDKFYEQCVSENKDLCLYGLPNETWEVKPPNSAPPILPEPAQGINQACVGLPLNDWRLLVAVHSDSWLLALAFYYGNIYGFDKETRRQLFMMITDLPTVLEVIMGSVNEQPKTSIGSSKDKSGSKQPYSNSDPAKHPLPKDQKQIGKEDNMCGVCEKLDEGGEFWIGCDFCRKWFHGECVRITPAMAKEIDQYKCPRCITKRSIE